MTSNKNVTSLKSIILSTDESKLYSLKYKIDDKFFLSQENLKRYKQEMQDLLKNKSIVVIIDSFEIDHMGREGYRLKFLDNNINWRWFVTEDLLDLDFLQIKKTSDIRFFTLKDN